MWFKFSKAFSCVVEWNFKIVAETQFWRTFDGLRLLTDSINFSNYFTYHSTNIALINFWCLKFDDFGYTDPFDLSLIFYIERICDFSEISLAKLLFYGLISCFLCLLSLSNHRSRRTYVYHVFWFPLSFFVCHTPPSGI